MASPTRFATKLSVAITFAVALGAAMVVAWEKSEELKKMTDDSLDKWVAPEFLRKEYPWYVSGVDRENRTIFVVEFGKWDIKSIVKESGIRFKLLDRYVYQALHKFIEFADKWNETHPEYYDPDSMGSVLIFDMNGFGLLQMASPDTVRYAMNVCRRFTLVEDKLAYGYFTNVNFLAHGLVRILKPVMGATVEKLEVLGTDPAQWLPKLNERISLDQLPPGLGGRKNFKPMAQF